MENIKPIADSSAHVAKSDLPADESVALPARPLSSPPAAASRSAYWYHGWNIVAACVLAQFVVSGLTVNCFSLFLHDWSAQLHSPISQFTLGFSIFGLLCSPLAALAGICADRYPARLMFGGGLLLAALMFVAMSFITRGWEFLVLYALPLPIIATFSALVPANAVVSRWFVRRLGLALALTALGQGLPGVILPPIVAAALPTLGWRMVWRIGGLVIGLIVLPIVVATMRDRPSARDGLEYLAGGGTAVRSHHLKGGARLAWRDVFTRRNFWALVVIFLSLLVGHIAMSTNLAPIAASRGVGRETVGVLLSIYNLAAIAAMLLAGFFSDRFGNRLPLAGLAFASAVGLLLAVFGASAPVLGLGVALVGACGGFWPLLAAATTREFGAEAAGRGFGFVTAFIPVIMLTPFLVARTQEITGSYAIPLSALALLIFTGAMVFLLTMRERRSVPAV